jgi:hypothetical protein
MTAEQIAALVGAAVLCLGNLAAWLKTASDVAKQKADRLLTKEARDKDSLELHDKVLKLEFVTTQLKDQQALTATVVDDLRDQCSTLNTNIVKLDMAVASLTEAIKELRK